MHAADINTRRNCVQNFFTHTRAQKNRDRKNKHFFEKVHNVLCKNLKEKCRCDKKHHGGEGGISSHDTPRICRGGGVSLFSTRDQFLSSIFESSFPSAQERNKRTREKEKLKDREQDAEEGEGERRVVARVVKAVPPTITYEDMVNEKERESVCCLFTHNTTTPHKIKTILDSGANETMINNLFFAKTIEQQKTGIQTAGKNNKIEQGVWEHSHTLSAPCPAREPLLEKITVPFFAKIFLKTCPVSDVYVKTILS